MRGGWLVTSLLLFSALCADEKTPPPSKGFSSSHSGKKVPELINPSARPVVTDNVDLFFIVDPLLMKPIQGGMEFAFRSDGGRSGYLGIPTPPMVNSSFTGSPVTRPINGTIRSGVGKWDWGVRIAAGYNMPHDGWDVTGTWLRFHTLHAKSNRPNNHGAPLAPLVAPPYSGQNVAPVGSDSSTLLTSSQTRARWHLNIDLIDLELGREFYVSKWMTLRPYLGPRAAFIPQSFLVTFRGGTFVSNFSTTTTPLAVAPTSVMRTHLSNHFWGAGPRMGLNSIWGLGAGFSIFEVADFSLLWGSFHVKSRFDITTPAGVQTTIVNIRNNHESMRPTTTLGVGVRYDYNFNRSYALAVFLGYENIFFWDQNQFMKFNEANSIALNAVNDDLTLSGFHLGVQFDF